MDEQEPEAAWLRLMLRDGAYPGTHWMSLKSTGPHSRSTFSRGQSGRVQENRAPALTPAANTGSRLSVYFHLLVGIFLASA